MSAAASPGVKQRGAKKRPTTPTPDSQNGDITVSEKVTQTTTKEAVTTEWDYKLAITVCTILAFVTRFWDISHPDQVVFDEVHFGKFASYYLQRTYFFDVHPPFGKLLFALAGWFVGYKGDFLFENIGDSYITNNVPYVAYRAMPATLGALTVPTVFMIMWDSGYSLPACLTATALVLFDNAHVGQTRLILLDAVLILSMALSAFCYVRFYKMRHDPFNRKWWKWLLLTGLSLSCVISTKYVGAFTFFSIGVPVMIDLWELLDVNRKRGALSVPDFAQHLGARVFALIVLPFIVYLFWFQVHFAILTKSGPGDEFMTPEFQETLSDNVMAAQSVGIQYFDSMNIRHKETKVYLHSHAENYPLRYDDGRISSQGQQVTGYPHNDTNNIWQIVPTTDYETSVDRPVKNGEVVQYRHLATDSYLLSHDVASPYFPTNQEFTTVAADLAASDRYNDTLFEIRIDNGKEGQEFRSKASHFKLIHFPTRVAMWTHTTPLPDWGHKQAEINGNKNIQQSSNVWFVEDLPQLAEDSPRRQHEEKKAKTMPFMKKYLELQRTMFFHNNALTSSHPYASFPIQWPFLLRGVSFWTQNDTREQIYFLGNPLGWWLASSLLAVFMGIIGADQLTQRRGVDALDDRTRSRLYNSTGFFFLLWAAHYVPFYIMGRQLFLHHYLPAHLASALVSGALLEFIFNVEPGATSTSANVIEAMSPNDASFGKKAAPKPATKQQLQERRRPIRERIGGQSLMMTWAAAGVVIAVIASGYILFAPLTYGRPGLDVEQVLRRKWLNYDLHFAK
ncbi:MAG: hypothetical protein M1828_001520 [Chrysothrix sp. TS-e1954]|nr:MAG: hypothetical protein M1828_001520 [Chrysothrix sp. TS-e1954]